MIKSIRLRVKKSLVPILHILLIKLILTIIFYSEIITVQRSIQFKNMELLFSSLFLMCEEGVTLLTGPAAKGLEFDYVFIVSLNQGIFPDFRAEKNERSLEEERRNFFVAITRTKKKLFLSYTHKKQTRIGYMNQSPSQFLYEVGLL
ncbi:3'-5' exonuclease [Neobacillus sp. SM06]|uniref:3'-5' exonuclease n=1 Tax=Neobacillus sp. SM06 TaxID=3422492 RepID=UPI003D268DE3